MKQKQKQNQKQKEAGGGGGGDTGVLGPSATKQASAKKKKTAGGASTARSKQDAGDRGKAGLSETKEG